MDNQPGPALNTTMGAPADRQPAEPTTSTNGVVEVYGKPLPDAATGQGRRRKQPGKAKGLNIRQERFVKLLTTPGSPTYGKKGPSALMAGYATRQEAFTGLLPNPTIQSAVEQQLKRVNADSEVRAGVVAELLHKQQHVTEQQDGTGKVISRTVVDNDKIRLAAARELAKLDGSYHRAAAIGHAQSKVLDVALDAWTKRLRASLANTPLDARQEPTVNDGMVDGSSMVGGQDGQMAGTGSTQDGTGGEGGQTDGGEGGWAPSMRK